MAAIVSYATLQTELANWMNRNDLTGDMPGFIQLAEQRMKRLLRYKRRMKTYTINSETGCIPVEAKELDSWNLVTGSPHLDRPGRIGTVEMVQEARVAHGGVVGRPTIAAIVGNQIMFGPKPDQNYDAFITFSAKLQPLSASNTVNDELRDAPDAYLFGSLLFASGFLEHDERIKLWEGMFLTAIDELNKTRDDAEFNAAIKDVRLPRVFG